MIAVCPLLTLSSCLTRHLLPIVPFRRCEEDKTAEADAPLVAMTAAEVLSDAGRGPAIGGQQDHFQSVADHRRQVGAAEGLKFASLGFSQRGVDHVTFYASPAAY
jgi:hypothetical protein